MGFMAGGIAFILIGVFMAVTGGRGMIKQDKLRRAEEEKKAEPAQEAEQEAAPEAPQPAEAAPEVQAEPAPEEEPEPVPAEQPKPQMPRGRFSDIPMDQVSKDDTSV